MRVGGGTSAPRPPPPQERRRKQRQPPSSEQCSIENFGKFCHLPSTSVRHHPALFVSYSSCQLTIRTARGAILHCVMPLEPIDPVSDSRVEHRTAPLNGYTYHYLYAEPAGGKFKATIFLVSFPIALHAVASAGGYACLAIGAAALRSESMVADGASHLQIHGWPDCSAGWRYQIPALLEMGFRVVAPDLMGFGGTVSLCCFMISHSILASLLLQSDPARVVGGLRVARGNMTGLSLRFRTLPRSHPTTFRYTDLSALQTTLQSWRRLSVQRLLSSEVTTGMQILSRRQYSFIC